MNMAVFRDRPRVGANLLNIQYYVQQLTKFTQADTTSIYFNS